MHGRRGGRQVRRGSGRAAGTNVLGGGAVSLAVRQQDGDVSPQVQARAGQLRM